MCVSVISSVQMCHSKGCVSTVKLLTLFTVNPLVGRTAYADSLDAGAMVGAGGVDTLTFLHITLCPLPSCQAHTPSFLIHTVATAQYGAWICNMTNTDYTHIFSSTHTQIHTHTVLQYISWETAVTYREWGYALLSQLERGFSKSSSSLCLPLFLSPSHTHAHTYTLSRLSLTLFQFTQAPPEPGYHGNPGIVENPPNVTSLALNRPWKQSWKLKIRKESIRGL